ncbi:MAG: hypothetical protein NZ898_04815 [Myxococcota bacterium]|nr:hypothetical protein [Myxococcota bacterium]MDW8361499.1 hypothetical protein [Myxococcales bacterium]
MTPMPRLTMPVVALAAAAVLAACGGAEPRLEPRYVTLHNTLTAMGLAQSAPLNQGSLPEGAEARLSHTLHAGQCYTFVALGTEGVGDIDLRVLDESGEPLASDATTDPQASVHVCPTRDGRHDVLVRMARGAGGYLLTAWSGGPTTAVAGRTSVPSGQGTCASPLALAVGRPVTGSTATASNAMSGSCAEGSAPEQVYRLVVEQRAQLSAVLQSGYDGVLYLLRTCGDARTEIVCNDDSPDTSRSEISATLDPGTYFLVVDGYASESGNYDLIVSFTDLQDLGAVCGDAPSLLVGHTVSGTTLGQPSYFQATCAAGARSPDRVYALDVPGRSRLRITQQSDHDGALYLRRQCAEAASELACNDDFVDNRRSLLRAVLDPGRYYVFSDGYAQGAAGAYSLLAELAPVQGGGAPGDTCADATPTSMGQELVLDTFQARDDLRGSCGGAGSPDAVTSITVPARSRLRVTARETQMNGVLYLQRTCGDTAQEVACSILPVGGEGTLDAVVQPGTYHLVLDGTSADEFGSARLVIEASDVGELERLCRSAPPIRPGRVVRGDTSGAADRFQATCAGGARSPDTVYRLRLARRSLVRIHLSTPNWDGALHLRRDCANPSTELACNDDHNDNRHSYLEQTLDAGTYFLIVDGFSQGNQGAFTLDVSVSQQ